MSLVELAERHRIVNKVKLYLKENGYGTTLDEVVYGFFNPLTDKYDGAVAIINTTITGVKHMVHIKEVNKYFKWRESYLSVRRDYLKMNPQVKCKDIFDFYDQFGNLKGSITRHLFELTKNKGKEC